MIYSSIAWLDILLMTVTAFIIALEKQDRKLALPFNATYAKEVFLWSYADFLIGVQRSRQKIPPAGPQLAHA